MGRVNLNQIFCWVPSLLFGLRPNCGRSNDNNDDLLQKGLNPHCCFQCPALQQATEDSRLCWRCGLVVACCRVRALTVAGPAWHLLKEVATTSVTPTIAWPQAKLQGGNTAHQLTENWMKDLLSMARPTRTGPSFSLSHLSHQEASISLLSFSIRGQTEGKPQSQKTNQSDHMDHSFVLLNKSMNHAV